MEQAHTALGREPMLRQASLNDYDIAHLTDDEKLRRYIELIAF